jgi:hypothetical protein
MSRKTLEDRVSMLEEQVRHLLARPSTMPGPLDWMQTVGMFSGNEMMKQLDAECLARRERERRRARGTKSKRRRVKV